MSGPGGAAAAALPARSWQDRFLDRRLVWGLLLVAGIAWAGLSAGVAEGDPVNEGGWPLLLRFLEAALHPELSGRFLAMALDAALVTLGFAVLGTVLSLVIGTVGGVLGSEVWWTTLFEGRLKRGASRLLPRAPWLAVRGGLALPRALHEIVWGVLLVNIVGLNPVVGILAIAIPYGAITAKVFSEILDETDRAALKALRNTGADALPSFLYGLVPKAFPDLVSYAFYRFECSIRSAAVLGIIGAGGLGYQIFLSMQSLRYEQVWTFLLALLVLTGLTDLWSGLLRRRLGSSHRVEILTGEAEAAVSRPGGPGGGEGGEEQVTEERASPPPAPEAADVGERGAGPARPAGRPARDPVVRWTGAALVALVAFSAWYVDADLGRLVSPRTARLATDFLARAWPPGLGGTTLGGVFDLSLATLAMSILAMAMAGSLGVALSFPAAHNLLLPGGIFVSRDGNRLGAAAGWIVFVLTRGLLLLLRAVPAPIWALVLLFVLFPGVLPGAAALGLYTLGVLGRLMAEVTENLDARPLRALKAQGASGLQVFLYGVLPATVPKFVSYLLYRWEVAIRATAMVGVVGAGGLGVLLTEQLSSFDYAAVSTTLLFYVGLTFLVDLVSALARSDLR